MLAAHRILVLNEGRIVEVGNHHELIEKAGLYARLYRAQRLGARDSDVMASVMPLEALDSHPPIGR